MMEFLLNWRLKGKEKVAKSPKLPNALFLKYDPKAGAASSLETIPTTPHIIDSF